ncbi:MAG TPA: transcription-repair coupling factor [Candidatus Acidoferrales bacterium]|nr:transcription-repair coupling factor [Candidatus Acidoferrales bacterium]
MILSEELNRLDTIKKTMNVTVDSRTLSLHSTSIPFVAYIISLLAKNESALLVINDSDVSERIQSDVTLFSGLAPVELISEEQPNLAGLFALYSGSKNLYICDYQSIFKNMPARISLQQTAVIIHTNSETDHDDLISKLSRYGYQKKDYVEEVGDYARRGSIVDIFPESSEHPIRIDFFGDNVESMRVFDLITQRSIENIDAFTLLPYADSDRQTLPFVDQIPQGTRIILYEPSLIPRGLLVGLNKFVRKVSDNTSLIYWRVTERNQNDFVVNVIPQPTFNGKLQLAANKIAELFSDGYKIIVASSTKHLEENFLNLLSEYDELNGTMLKEEVKVIQASLSNGFILPDDKFALFTEHEIFGRRSPLISRKEKAKKFIGLLRRDLNSLRTGDYVVHEGYGIGKFIGMEKLKIIDSFQECVKIEYAEGDMLYVNIDYIGRLQRYASEDGFKPKLSKLGSSEWQMMKIRAKGKLKDIAKDLIKLYAERKKSKGFSFQRDSIWQHELEASFVYEDTTDQVRATAEIKNDMERESPMDRLLCGDVGFGKTEVAVRTAFKAVMSGKQVAVLVPTTILAEQHFNTFRDRLSNYATKVEVLSRFKKKSEQKTILDSLKNGSVDIIIGTHRLLSSDVVFHDLGLLIIDEEHRFGVQAKEKIRQFKANVDTLYMTATPIPRTLYMSLSSAMDISVLQTPPANRLPIDTYVVGFDGKLLQSVIERELHRGGQVYVVSDTIKDLGKLADFVHRRAASAKAGVIHGKMKAAEIERTMIQFLEKKLNVLIATKIIESGIDIPSVNTLIVNNADRFGLAELYQLRGRIGRSNIQAYAYLIAKEFSNLTRDAVRRLTAIEEFTELGSGFNLAMRDLEIRGAGNLLGKEQSGFINNMGLDMYNKVLEEAVAEAKFEENLTEQLDILTRRKIEPRVTVDVDAFIPDDYIPLDAERFDFYKRLSRATTTPEIDDIRGEIVDRFGKIPDPAENLLRVIKLKIKLEPLRIPKLEMRGSVVKLQLPSDDQEFYKEIFPSMMNSLDRIKDIKHGIAREKSLANLEITFTSTMAQNDAEKVERLERLIEVIKINEQ